MILPFVLLLAAELPNRVVPHGVGVQSGRCYAKLRSGKRIVDGERVQSNFTFDRDYALEGFSFYDGGGTGLYKRYGTEWCVITRGGGAFDESYAKQSGVPAPVAHRLFHADSVEGSDHR